MGIMTVAWSHLLLAELIAIIGWSMGWGHGRHWLLLIVSIGGCSVGLLLGFLYSSYGSEKDDFKPFANAISGVIGGALGADLLRGHDSVSLRALRSTALACGLPGGGGVVGLIFASGLTAGFIGFYLVRKLGLNERTAEKDRKVDHFLQRNGPSPSDDVDRLLNPSGEGGAGTVRGGPDAALATAIAQGTAADAGGNPARLVIGSRAALAASTSSPDPNLRLEMADRAISLARQAVRHDPQDVGPLQALANAQFNRGDYAAARATLERLLARPDAPATARKLLAHTLLYLNDYAEAERVINGYLHEAPNDEGAKLTLLAALAGQRKGGANSPGLKERIVTLARELLASPAFRRSVERLSLKPDEELSVLRTDPELAKEVNLSGS